MTESAYNQITDAIKRRENWETRQSRWYRMRHFGLKRQGKPYAGAPDTHFPLADTLIEKLKAFVVQLIYATETLASFVSRKPDQDSSLTSAVANWYDYQLKQRSNFEREVMVAIDQTQQSGMQLIKCRWDSDCKALSFDSVDPLYVIVPQGTQEIKDADWLVHVIPISVDEYKANPLFNQDEDFVKSIRGKGTNIENSGITNASQDKTSREGLTYSDDDNEIIIWECYLRDRQNKCIQIETVSPLLGCDGEAIRQPFTQPYEMGVFKSGQRFPFIKLRTEIKDKGYYSERGIPETVEQFEQFLNKTWNTRCTWQDFFSKPMFRRTIAGVSNLANFKTGPGKVAPFGLDVIQPPAIPASLDEDMQFGRALAEYRVSIPDLGAGQHLTPVSRPEGRKTAREVSSIMDLSSMSNDVRARVFRLDFGELLNMAWSLLIHFAKEELTYVLQDEVQSLDAAALHDEYDIKPNGSPDSWNKGAQLQKAMSRFQAFNGDPYIDQGELRKSVLELDDPALVKRLYHDPGDMAKEQAEQQAVECLLMLNGWPAQVSMADDDKTHLITLGQFFERRLMQKEPITPELAQLGLQHGGQHDAQLAKKNDPEQKAIRAQLAPMVQLLTHIAQSPPANVIPLQAGANGSVATPNATTGVTSGQNPPATPQDESDRVSDATKVGNMLAGLLKAGVQINTDEINKVMAELNLPPVQQPVAPQFPQQQTR